MFQIISSLQKVMVIPSICHSIYSFKDHIDFLSFIDNIAYTRYSIITRVVILHAYMATDKGICWLLTADVMNGVYY